MNTNTTSDTATTLPTILVVGATGKVGGEVVRQLQKAGDNRVIAAIRNPERAKTFEDMGVETMILDLDKVETIQLRDIDRALLLTGYTVDMMKQSKRFLDAAKRDGVQHIVHIGASGADTNEVAHWTWHAMVEAYIEKLHFRSYTHLQPEAFMQNILPTGFGWFDGQQTLNHFIGDATWSWVDCDDLALVASIALREPQKYNGRTIRLGYDAKDMNQVGEILGRAMGRNIKVNAHDPDEFLKAVLAFGADPAYMNCVYTQFKLNIENKIPGADETFAESFHKMTGQAPTSWADFASRVAKESNAKETA